jgi:hypothetical protein
MRLCFSVSIAINMISVLSPLPVRAEQQMRPSIQACVNAEVPLLDDGISSADVIAGAVAEECRSVMERECAQCSVSVVDAAVKLVKSRAVVDVLKYRASKSK